MDALFASVEQPDNIQVLQNKMILRAGNAGIDREILNELHAQRAWQRLLLTLRSSAASAKTRRSKTPISGVFRWRDDRHTIALLIGTASLL